MERSNATTTEYELSCEHFGSCRFPCSSTIAAAAAAGVAEVGATAKRRHCGSVSIRRIANRSGTVQRHNVQ